MFENIHNLKEGNVKFNFELFKPMGKKEGLNFKSIVLTWKGIDVRWNLIFVYLGKKSNVWWFEHSGFPPV